MTIYGNGYPAYNNGVTGVNLNYSTVTADEPETDAVINRSDIDGFRDSDVRGQRWKIEININLFKYADYGEAILAQLYGDLGNKNITLWRHVNGNPMSGTFTLTNVKPFYLNQGRHKDRVSVTFLSNDFVQYTGTNYTVEYINSIALEDEFAGFVPSHMSISGRFLAVTYQHSVNGQTMLFDLTPTSPTLAPSLIDSIVLSDVLSPVVTNYPMDCLIEDRARPMLHISYWAQGMYGFYFNENEIIKLNSAFFSLTDAQMPTWNNHKGLIYFSQRTKQFSLLNRVGETYNIIADAVGGGAGGTTVYIDSNTDGSLIATATTDATGKLYVSHWDGTTLSIAQSSKTLNVREVAFDNKGYLWAQGRGGNSCFIYSVNADGTSVIFKKSLNPYGAESWIGNIDNFIWLGNPNNNVLRQYYYDPIKADAIMNQQVDTLYRPAGVAKSSGNLIAVPTYDNVAGEYFIEIYKKVRN